MGGGWGVVLVAPPPNPRSGFIFPTPFPRGWFISTPISPGDLFFSPRDLFISPPFHYFYRKFILYYQSIYYLLIMLPIFLNRYIELRLFQKDAFYWI